MPTTQESKKKFIEELNALASDALLAVTADYRGLSAAELSDLRARAARRGVTLRVLKNTLAKRALVGTAYEALSGEISGPTLIAFSHAEKEPGAAARILCDYRRENEKLKVKSVSLAHELLPAGDIDRLADLPTHEEALAKLTGLMSAPLARLLAVMRKIPSQVVHLTSAYAERKKSQPTDLS